MEPVMKKKLQKFARIVKRHGLDMAAAGIGLALLATLEMRAAWAAFELAPHSADVWSVFGTDYPRAALQHTLTSLLFGLLAFTLWRISADLRDDERPRIRERALSARIAALMCLCVPVGYLANAGGLERQLKAQEAYAGSDAYRLDLQLASRTDDMGNPAPGSGDARDRLVRAEKPSEGRPSGGDWGFAIFAHLLVMFCAGVKSAAPISHHERKALQAEAEAQRKSEIAKRAAKTRAANRRQSGNVFAFR
jgi:hypothetical protein